MTGCIVAQTLGVGPDTFKIGCLVLLEHADGLFKIAYNVCRLRILFLVLLYRKSVLDAEPGGDKCEHRCDDEQDADRGGKS